MRMFHVFAAVEGLKTVQNQSRETYKLKSYCKVQGVLLVFIPCDGSLTIRGLCSVHSLKDNIINLSEMIKL